MGGFDFRQATLPERGVLIAAVVAFVASWLPYVGVPGFQLSAWSGFAIVGLLMLFGAAVVVGLQAFTGVVLPHVPGGWGAWASVGSGLGTLLVILRAISVGGPYAEYVPVLWGGYVLFVAGIAQTVFAIMYTRAIR